jgi:hypothetical protein
MGEVCRVDLELRVEFAMAVGVVGVGGAARVLAMVNDGVVLAMVDPRGIAGVREQRVRARDLGDLPGPPAPGETGDSFARVAGLRHVARKRRHVR